MKKRTIPTLPTQTPVEPTTEELIESVIALVNYSRGAAIKVQFVVTVLENEQGDWCGAVGVLYAAESTPNLDNSPRVPLQPFFYPAEVCRVLEQRGIIKSVHTSRRTGINCHWFDFAETFI